MAGKRFTLNGSKPLSLSNIAKEVLQNYANAHTKDSAQDIRDLFVSTFKGIGVAHIVETEPEYHLRDGESSQERTVKEVIIPNGEKLYVSTQWRANKPGANFFRFRDIVNTKGWGIIK